MSRKTTWCVLVVVTFWVTSVRAQSQRDRYEDGEEPTPPEPLPAVYHDYQILPGSLSPDQGYALIYPRRAVIFDLNDYGLFLVAFRPFRVLSSLPLGNSNLCGNARCSYFCQWSSDSSILVMVAGSRWGPERVSAVNVRAGRVIHRAELTAPVRRLVRPDFRRSKAPRYNDYYDFVLTDNYSSEGGFVEIPEQDGWIPDAPGRVRVDCVCTNDPKLPEPKDWTVRFTGTWDFKRGGFVEHRIVRIPPPSKSEVE